MHSVVRYRVLSLSYFERLLETASGRPGAVPAMGFVFGLVGLTAANGLYAAGSYLYVADSGSTRLRLDTQYYLDGSRTPELVRTNLWSTISVRGRCWPARFRESPSHLSHIVSYRKVTSTREASKRGVSFLVGFKIEFILFLKSTLPEPGPTGTHGGTTIASIHIGSTGAIVLEEIANALLQMRHTEAAPGQCDVVTGTLSPLQVSDALVCSREVIYSIANIHQLRATFAPRVYRHSCRSPSLIQLASPALTNCG